MTVAVRLISEYRGKSFIAVPRMVSTTDGLSNVQHGDLHILELLNKFRRVVLVHDFSTRCVVRNSRVVHRTSLRSGTSFYIIVRASSYPYNLFGLDYVRLLTMSRSCHSSSLGH